MKRGRRVVITGIGLLCPLGQSAGALHDALAASRWGAGPLPADVADDHLAGRNTYPLDRPARLLTAAARLALDDAGWTPESLARHDVGLFAGTVWSSAQTIARFDRQAVREGPAGASPLDFANTVINAPAGQTAIWHGLRGVNRTVATGSSSGLEAIGCAAEAILGGQADCLLAGGVDELSELSVRAFAASGLLCRSERPRPYDPASQGLALTEGAALLVLEEATVAARRGARVLAEYLGYGRAFDAAGRTDERRSVRSAVRALRAALESAGLGTGDVDIVCGSANGDARADRHEALALSLMFEAEARPPAVCAVKGQIGEALGAGGPLQCAVMIESLRRGRVPAPLALRATPTGDVVVGPDLTPPRAASPRTCLVSSLGLDGHSCALALASSSTLDSLDAT